MMQASTSAYRSAAKPIPTFDPTYRTWERYLRAGRVYNAMLWALLGTAAWAAFDPTLSRLSIALVVTAAAGCAALRVRGARCPSCRNRILAGLSGSSERAASLGLFPDSCSCCGARAVTRSDFETETGRPPRRLGRALFAVAGVLVLLAGGGWAAYRHEMSGERFVVRGVVFAEGRGDHASVLVETAHARIHWNHGETRGTSWSTVSIGRISGRLHVHEVSVRWGGDRLDQPDPRIRPSDPRARALMADPAWRFALD